MHRVLSSLTGEHDWRLVILAGIICLLASLVAVSLFHRARAARARPHARRAWLLLAGAATGCGIWATHFIGMLAYDPGVPIAYHIGLTLASFVVATLVTTAGLFVAVRSLSRWAAPAGGVIIGAGVAAMHFIGMSALQMPSNVSWSLGLVLGSVALSVALAASALTVAVWRQSWGGAIAAAALLAFAIVSHHFTAMSAVRIVVDPMLATPRGGLTPTMVALAVAAAAIAVLGMSLVGAFADSFLARRMRQFERAQRELIADSKELLRQQNVRLDAALNNMTQGLCMFDANEQIVVFNRRFLEMYKLSPQVVKPGCSLRELIDHRHSVGLLRADPEQYYRSIIDEVHQGRTTTALIETTDGRLVQALNQPMPGGGWVTTHEDVTERHDAEEQVREQKLQMDAALDNISQGLLMFGADGRLILWNHRYLELYRLAPDAMKPGLTLPELHALRKDAGTIPLDPDFYVAELQSARAEGKPVTFAIELADGRIISVENHPMPDGRWVSTHEDITERLRAEKQLREQKLQLDAALDNMSQGLVMFGPNARLLLCNSRYIELYGLSPADVRPGMTLQDLLVLRKAAGNFSLDPDTYVTGLRRDLAAGKVVILTPELADGRIVSIENHPMPDGRWLSTHEDITERRLAERQLREQKLQLDTALNNMSQGLNMFDAVGRLVVCNQRYLRMYGLSPEVVKPGCTVGEMMRARIDSGTFFSTDPERYIAELLEGMKRREPGNVTMELPDGRTIAVLSQPTPDGSGWVVTHEDITERRRTEMERDRSQAFANTVIENVPSTIIVKDARTLRYVLVNRAAEEYCGISRENMVGKLAEEVFGPEEAETIAKHDEEILRTGQPQFFDERPVTTPSGDLRIATTTRMSIRDSNGQPQYLLTMVEDRTRRRRAEAQIARLVHHDVLTGLPNRSAFTSCIAATVETATNLGESFALISLDFDRFKEVNDVYGHVAGDEMLRQVSTRLQVTVGGAFLARLGGDEFVVIATDGEQPGAAEDLAERILAAVNQDMVIHEQPISASFSIGIAIFPVDGADATTLIGNVDAALYRAKSEGGGTYRFFEPDMDKRLRERRVLQQELRSAIERGELILQYQPQARIDGEIIGFEALVRWRHPQRGLIPPGVFIPLAEESGLIVSMGGWILREACRQAASWKNPLQIAINLSPVQFRHGDLPGLVHSVLLETGLPPSRLELEITEGVLIDDFSRGLSILRRLKALGVHIAMDDFGTGYSSLSYLQSFPFDKIKIDKAFITNLERHTQSATIVRAVIGLARGLGLPVLAEGVETEEQLAFLTKESCDQFQGFLIGRPLPIDEYAALTGQPKTRTKTGGSGTAVGARRRA